MDKDERERLRHKALYLAHLRDQILSQDKILKDVLPRTQSWQGASESIMKVLRHLFDELSAALPKKNIVNYALHKLIGLRG